MVWVGRNSMNLLVKVHGGASYNGRNSMNLLVRVHGSASCNGRNSMRVTEGPSLWQDNDLRCLKANLVCGRVKPIGNDSIEQ